MIYQVVNDMTEILPLATSYIAHLCSKSNLALVVLVFKFFIIMPGFKSVHFYHNMP